MQVLGKRKCINNDQAHEKKQKTEHKIVPTTPTAPPTRTYEGDWLGTKYILMDEPILTDEPATDYKRKATLTYVTSNGKDEEKKEQSNTVSFSYIDCMYKIRQQDRDNYIKQKSDASLPDYLQEWQGFDWQPYFQNQGLCEYWFLKMSELQQLKQMQVEYFFRKSAAHMEDVVQFVCEVDPLYWSTVFHLTITTKHPQTGQETTFTSSGTCNPTGYIPEVSADCKSVDPNAVILLGDYFKWGKITHDIK